MQTLYPTHYSIRHACRQDYAAFYRRGDRIPPGDALPAGRRADQRRRRGRARATRRWRTPRSSSAGAARPAASPFRVLGPAPAPLGRLKGEHRAQFFIKGTQPRHDARRCRGARRRPETARRTIVDVDPMSAVRLHRRPDPTLDRASDSQTRRRIAATVTRRRRRLNSPS